MTRPGESGIETVSAGEARTLLMLGQGLLDDPSRRAGPRSVDRTIQHMGFVQIDSINVVERAHHLILHSRLHGYAKRHLRQLAEKDRACFEHWTHDASMIPTEHYAHWKGRFQRHKPGAWIKQRMGCDGETICQAIRDRMEREGPLRSRDVNEGLDHRNGKWWGWSPAKAALELMWRRGEVLITRRERFEKVYDLAHRVLPDHHDVAVPDRDQTIDWACRTALERLGVGTASAVSRFWGAISIAEARQWLESGVKGGQVRRVMIAAAGDGRPKAGYAVADWHERLKTAPPAPDGVRLLCPFDPVIRDRDRLQRLFGFDYRFEAFVPEAKRRYGYYVLPVLERDRFIARINPKLHRDRGVLEIKGLWWEPRCSNRRRVKQLEGAVERLAAFVGAGQVDFAR